MKFCTKGHIFENTFQTEDCECPIKDCGGHIIECDDMIAPAVLEFNKKGYDTLFSCSGHYGGGLEQIYIAFAPMLRPDAVSFISEIIRITESFERAHDLCINLYQVNDADFDLVFSKKVMTISYWTFHDAKLSVQDFKKKTIEEFFMDLENTLYADDDIHRYVVDITTLLPNNDDGLPKIENDNYGSILNWYDINLEMLDIALNVEDRTTVYSDIVGIDSKLIMKRLVDRATRIDIAFAHWYPHIKPMTAKHSMSGYHHETLSSEGSDTGHWGNPESEPDDDIENPEDADPEIQAKVDAAISGLDRKNKKKHQKKSK